MPSSTRFVCIHGHFYHPPSENPWLETVETQDAAAPYHDWNEHICSECYAPNGAARIVNNENQITHIVNNYARISFDFGPTLLAWLKENAPRTYRMILDGERRSRKRYRGHSSAMAQVYNHMILPLASRRDRITQIRWGIADYEHRYGAAPEGMWLPETAADAESLELLADHGIKFTLLAPHQCKRLRPLKNSAGIGDAAWTDTPGATVDTTRPYLVRFASGSSMAVFFYNAAISRVIAFEGLLDAGEAFAARLKSTFKDRSQPQLVHVTTDGESYGYHHKHGEMALASAISVLEQDETVTLTNYGSFLDQFPPEYECEIVGNSSWSCVHGVERWRSNCGCNGGKPGFNQEWRAPLRQALDELRDALAPLTEQEGVKLFRDVWAARDSYIQVVLDRSEESISRFFSTHSNHALSDEERIRALELMEMQRNTQLMYTSCGWFLDDISGDGAVQVIAYAARVLQLAREIFFDQSISLEQVFEARLREARSNVASAQDGASIYKGKVRSLEVGLEQVVAHYAISSVFSSFAEEIEMFCFLVRRISYDVSTSGPGRVAVGRAHIASAITGHNKTFSFAVLHFGDQNISAAVKPYDDADADGFEAFAAKAAAEVRRADFPRLIHVLEQYFGSLDYSLTSLFADEQRRIVQIILHSTLWDIESSLTTIYEKHASLLHYLSEAGLPKPPELNLAAGLAINAGLRRVLESDPIDQAQLQSFLSRAKDDQVQLNSATLSYIAGQRMKRVMIELQMSSGSVETLERAVALARTLAEVPFELNLWQAQNIWHEILRTSSSALTSLAGADRPQWDKMFRELGVLLSIDCAAIFARGPSVYTNSN